MRGFESSDARKLRQLTGKLLWSCAVMLLVRPALGASFDCARAKTPVEKTICADPHLSALDDQLNQAYQGALKKAGEADVVVRHQQRMWLNGLQDKCDGAGIGSCVEQQETARIRELNLPVGAAAQMTEYKITRASQHYDFVVRIFADPKTADNETRQGPGRVLVYPKGSTVPMQTIVMDNMFVSLDKAGQPLVNSAKLYEYQGLINVGDFNFDGHEDFAVQNGNEGAYQGPSYNVYLYSPSKNVFEFSKPMTELIAGSLGFFQVDAAKKELVTFSKDGCCYHETNRYAVRDNKPIAVSRVVDDATKSDKYDYISEQKMVNGKWVGPTKRVLREK